MCNHYLMQSTGGAILEKPRSFLIIPALQFHPYRYQLITVGHPRMVHTNWGGLGRVEAKTQHLYEVEGKLTRRVLTSLVNVAQRIELNF